MITKAHAIHIARSVVNLDPGLTADVFPVRRLDSKDDYFLIIFRDKEYSYGLVIIGIRSGEVKNSARIKSRLPYLTVDKSRALHLASLKSPAQAELVWKPCQASRSPLYPIWRVWSSNKEAFIDQGGRIWKELSDSSSG